MKKLFTLAVLILCSLLYVPCSNAQGNLQFNQVLVLTSGANYTVPADKVLKIESILSDGTATLPYLSCTGACNFSGVVCTVDGISFRLSASTSTSSCLNCPASVNSTGNFINLNNYVFPIWLSSGKIVTVSPSVGIRISAIEFNVVP